MAHPKPPQGKAVIGDRDGPVAATLGGPPAPCADTQNAIAPGPLSEPVAGGAKRQPCPPTPGSRHRVTVPAESLADDA
jgi:hypothetical protein